MGKTVGVTGIRGPWEVCSIGFKPWDSKLEFLCKEIIQDVPSLGESPRKPGVEAVTLPSPRCHGSRWAPVFSRLMSAFCGTGGVVRESTKHIGSKFGTAESQWYAAEPINAVPR